MPDLIPFHFDTHEVRVHLDDNAQPWWVLADACAVLGLINPSDVAKRLDHANIRTLAFTEGGRPSGLLLINEPGLYELIFRSNKPEAKLFRVWVFTEVLPQIRKTGRYETPPPRPMTTGQMFLLQAQAMVELEARQDVLEATQQKQAQQIAQIQARRPPQDRLSIAQFLKTYRKPFLPADLLRILRQACREREAGIMFRPEYADYPIPYYRLDTLHAAYAKATEQLSFFPSRLA